MFKIQGVNSKTDSRFCFKDEINFNNYNDIK